MTDALMKAFVQFRADDTGLRQDAEAKVKTATEGLSGTAKIELDTSRLDRQRTDLQAKLSALGARATTIRASLDVNDKDGLAKAAAFQVRLAALDKKVASPKIKLDGVERAEAQMLMLDAQMSRAGKSADGFSVSSLGAAKGLGTLATAAIALGPALIPVAAAATAAMIGFAGVAAAGAAALGVFGATAKAQFTDLAKGYKNIQTLKDAAAKAPPGSAQQANDLRNLAIAQQNYAKTFGPAAAGMNNMQAAWTRWKQSTSGPTMSILAQGMNLVAQALPKLRPLFDAGAQAAQHFLTAIQGWVSGGGMDRAVKLLADLARAAGPSVQATLRNLASIAATLAPLFFDLGVKVAAGMARMTGAMAAWAGNQGVDAMNSFMAYLRTNGAAVVGALVALAAAAVNIARALAPLAPVSLAIATALARLVASLPPAFIQIIAGVVVGVKLWAAATWLLNAALAANPIVLAVVAIAALAAGIYYAWTRSAAFRDVLISLWNTIKTVAGAIAGAFTTAVGAITAAFSRVTSVASSVASTIAAPFINAFNSIKNFVTSSFDTWWASNGEAVKKIWSAVWTAVTAIFHSIWDPLTAAIRAGWAVIQQIFSAGSAAIQGTWNVAWDVIKTVASAAWTVIRAIFSVAWAAITAAWNIAWNLLSNIAKVMWAAIEAIIKIGWDVVVGIFTVAINLLTGRWGAAWDAMRNMLTQVWNAMRAFLNTALSGFTSAITGTFNTIVQFFAAVGGRILSALGNVGSLLVSAGQAIINGLLNGIKAVWNTVVGWFAGLPSAILKALGIASPPQWAIDAGGHIMNGLLKGIAHGAGDVKGFFTGLASSVTGPLKAIWGGIASAASSVWNAVAGVFGGGSGVEQWRGLVTQALAMLGLPASLAGQVLYQMQTESGGNPNIWNTTDCLTLDYVILTKRGWLRHDQVQPGDETIGYNPQTQRSEWTPVTRVVRYDDAEVWRIGNRHWHANVTPNHRWWSDTMTRVQPAFETCPECGWVPRGRKMPARGVQVHRMKIHGVAPARGARNNLRGEFVRTDHLAGGHRLRLAAPADTGGIPGLSLDEARIIAWLQGDGSISPVFAKPETCPECGWVPGDSRSPRRTGSQPANAVAVHRAKKHGMGKNRTTGELAGYDGRIWQSKPAQIIKLRALLARVEHTETVRHRGGGTQPARAFHLRRSYVTDLLKRSRLMETGPEAFVLALSPDQRAAWLDSMIDAEGHRQPVPVAEGAGRHGANGEFVRIAQIDGPLQDAIKLAVFLEGYRPTYAQLTRRSDQHQPAGHVGMARPHIAPSMFAPHEVLERQPVWCVTTELGTWTTRGGDALPFLTGNSNAAAGTPSGGLLAHAGHRSDVRRLPCGRDQQ